MSEESLTSQDKEELKRHLELLQKEYERTALRLQRAERREVVRKHVQNTITEQNRLLHINTSATLEQSCSSSSPELLSNRGIPSDTTKVRFNLPDASPFSTLTCRRSPSRTHRLRSRRSRLRLQIRERESDTEESQERTSEGTGEWCREERGDAESEREWTREEKEKDVERGGTEEENREEAETMKDGWKKNEESLTALNLQSAAENSSISQSPSTVLLDVNDPPADQSALGHSPSASRRPIPSSQSRSEAVTDAGESPGSADFLTSCTLIEGLPFPVEYYVRTTRRMASAHSSVDLYAVIQSQLSNGRGRRRSSRGCVVSKPSSEKPPDESGRGKKGRRGRRGRGRACESDSSGQSESLLQSPTSLSQEESEPIPSLGPSSDPQRHLSREIPPDSRMYPIFRKRRGRAAVSRSQIPAGVNDPSRLLPSLTSLAEALRRKDFRNLGGPMTILDVQDFHLPDAEFGQLKLERLRSSCSSAESLAYGACVRKTARASISTGGQAERETPVSEALPHSASLVSSLPLMFTEFSQAETENAGQSEREIGSHTEELSHRSVTTQAETHHDRAGGERTRLVEPNDPHTRSASRSLMLNLSMSSTSHTQTGHDTSLISLGATPSVLATPPSSELTPLLSASDQDAADHEDVHVPVNPHVQVQGHDVSEHTYSTSYSADISKTEVKTPEPANGILINTDVETQGCDVSDENRVTLEDSSTREINAEIPELIHGTLVCSETEREHHIINAFSPNAPSLSQIAPSPSQNSPSPSQNSPSPSPNAPSPSQNSPSPSQNGTPNETLHPDTNELSTISELDLNSQTPASEPSLRGDIDVNVLTNEASALPGVSTNQREDTEATSPLNLVKTSRTHTPNSLSQHVELLSCGSLQKTHTLKALDGGCVLDVCVVRWPSDGWCVCVAGEWSVCVWKQKAGVSQWSLLHTWTFTQSVISLQGIPDTSALLCVCLGRLEITEARILYCPGADSEFSQAELCKGALQAVLPVSDHRVTCCSAPGPQQNVQVFTLTQDGRRAETLSLVSTYHTIQTLVLVEKEKDALIGWTEHKSLLIWNMRSGQLLQTIHLAECVTTATCLRGYSYGGALCVLLQQASACHEETSSTLFTLIATNPLTGKYFTLSSITSPSAPTERLIDGDVCESALVGVFQSGLAIWSLTEGVDHVYANEPAEVCRLARWAGPNTLLTGYLNGDVNIYQFKPTGNRAELKIPSS